MIDDTTAQGTMQQEGTSTTVETAPVPGGVAPPAVEPALKPEASPPAAAPTTSTRAKAVRKSSANAAPSTKQGTGARTSKAAAKPVAIKAAPGSKPAARTAAKPAVTSPSAPASKATTTAGSGAQRKLAQTDSAKPAQKPRSAVGASEKSAPQKPPADAKAPESALSSAEKLAKPKKAKLKRDSFTMPETEYDLIAAVKKRCIAKGLAVKKSEVLRAAVIGFAAQGDTAIMTAIQSLEIVKTGRPPKKPK